MQGVTMELYGPDKTAWVPVPAAASGLTYNLTTPIAVN